jgi:hypothetical protein
MAPLLLAAATTLNGVGTGNCGGKGVKGQALQVLVKLTSGHPVLADDYRLAGTGLA